MKRGAEIRHVLAAAGAALAVLGCEPPSTEVFVDVPAVLAQGEVTAPDKPRLPAPPSPDPAMSASIAGKPRLRLADRPRASGDEIRSVIRQAQERAFQDVQRRLRRFYDTELARFELDRERLQAEATARAYTEADQRIRDVFEEYAKERMPVYVQLTLYAGFPDPNPSSARPENPLPPFLKHRFDRSVELREQLKAIDLAFDRQVRQILSSVEDLTAQHIAEMRLAIEQFKSELDRRALEEARAQVRQTTREMGLELIEPVQVELPATEAVSVRVPAEQPLPSAPVVPTAGILRGRRDRERLLRHELNIWAGLNRYRVVERAGGAPDRTQEFVRWREKFKAGP